MYITDFGTKNLRIISNISLSNPEFEIVNAISIFPIPAKDNIEIKANHVIESITVYDVQGRRVFSNTINASNASIDVSSLEAELFFVSIHTVQGNLIKKFVKE